MFERSLSALIKGLRSHRGKDEPKYVAQVMDEIRHEVRSGDMEVKAEAVLKLTYLQMLGYPFSGASFHMLETMASPKYHHKHVGYLAAAQCFSPDTDVLILATNMIKKDLHSSNPLDVAVALNGLSHIVTPDLARHLGPDVISLLTHTRSTIRKKALLVLYAMIIKCPDMLEASWDRLREKLEDSDLGVISAAVNIICELARRDPRPFLPLSPQLFHLLTTSTNNWMLIKIIKLFGALSPLEPRLVKKLVPPISTIISTTPAMSLLYECIHTIIIGGMLTQPGGDELAETCVDKLATFLTDHDQNLKYIALLALVKILPTHPHLVAQYQQVIFDSIEDPDLSIRLRALELVSGMAVSRNLESIVKQLMSHLEPTGSTTSSSGQNSGSAAAAALKASLGVAGGSDADPSSSSLAAITSANNPTLSPSYRLEIVNRILALGSYDTYSSILNFAWWIDTLLELVMITNLPDDTQVGSKIRDQLIDITSRVRAVRSHAVRKMTSLLKDPRMVPPRGHSTQVSALGGGGGGDELTEARKVLHAAAWILGEYCYEVPTPAETITLLLQSTIFDVCDPVTSAACVHNAIKLFAFWASAVSERWEEAGLTPEAEFSDIRSVSTLIASSLDHVINVADDSELQERAVEYRQLFRLIEKDLGQSAVATKMVEEQEDKEKDTKNPTTGTEEKSTTIKPTSKPPKSLNLLSPLFFNHTLGPVGEKAQLRVPIPEGLDLEEWIVQPDSYIVTDSINLSDAFEEMEKDLMDLTTSEHQSTASKSKTSKNTGIQDAKEAQRLKKERIERQLHDPFYISSGTTPNKQRVGAGMTTTTRLNGGVDGRGDNDDDVDSIPIVKMDLNLESHINPASHTSTHTADTFQPPVLEQEEMPEKTKSLIKKKKKPRDSSASATDQIPNPNVESEPASPTPTKVVTKKKKPFKKGTVGVAID